MNRTEFCEYLKRYEKQLYIVAYAILKNEADAEDAVCSAVLKGYEHLEQLRNPHKFKPWLITITKNEALQIKRKRLSLPGDEKIEAMLGKAYDNHMELWDIVQELKEEYRLVIVLYYYADLSIKDISKVLNIPIGTVKSRLNRGREFLKAALEKMERRESNGGNR